MDWLIPALATIVFGVGYNILVKVTSKEIEPATASLLVILGAMIPVLVYLGFKFLTSSDFSKINSNAVFLVLLGGIFMGISTMFYFSTYVKGGTLSSALPLIMIGTVAIVSLFGIFMLREDLGFIKIIGLGFGLISIYLLAS